MLRLLTLTLFALTLIAPTNLYSAAPPVALPPPPIHVTLTSGPACPTLMWHQQSTAPSVWVSAGATRQERDGAPLHTMFVCGMTPGDMVTITEVWPDAASYWAEIYQFSPMTVYAPLVAQ